ncbi:class D beta-lactamase [Portibacter lacus]|uniref:Beta-lactamase n=1 Tax=Portibacter lacus TaxID=1099794 RepID=A0AA37SNE2_9BACT|nr:class D beta-lactamase [Portibacter lacus]GLR15753.1 beta-lactamase [Portibacter lacus]
MKFRSLIFLAIWFYAFTLQIKETPLDSEPIKIVQSSFQDILDSANVAGSILLYDLEKNTFYSNDFDHASKSFIPASTFKIPNSLMALELGIVEDGSTEFKWDGQVRSVENWNQDLTFKQAFHYSCVPCYQKIARNIGVERLSKYTEDFGYGHLDINSSNVDMFWLEGSSSISQMQQIDFLKRFYLGELPISERTERIAKEMMAEKNGKDFKLIGKTGLSMSGVGWYVGYLEKDGNTYFFATNLQMKEDTPYAVRRGVTMAALEDMDIWQLKP